MNQDIAIRVSNLSKSYSIGKQKDTSLRSSLSSMLKSSNSKVEKFWALKDVSFEINKGDVIGIIGKNGAGKSTLLKILSQITKPTEGRIEINGRIASLLEVGTGFHPELTGRENIYLNGTILGMTRKEVKEKFDEIVAFSGVEKFIDTPVKHYSSGMYVRLAFAVAAHLEPEILIIDEVLAVGDAEFQKKCLGKMKDVSKGGKTVIFVSHNMAAIKTLCNKGLVLSKGQVVYKGDADSAVLSYFSNNEFSNELTHFNSKVVQDIFSLNDIQIKGINKNYNEAISEDDQFEIITDINFYNQDASRYAITYHIYNEYGEVLFSISSHQVTPKKGINKIICCIPNNFFQSGSFSLSIFIVKDRREAIFIEQDIKTFSIIDGKRELGVYMGREPGSINPKFDWILKS